jgi:outer membrane protein OmpA-like peptidoglycan-associated protein
MKIQICHIRIAAILPLLIGGLACRSVQAAQDIPQGVGAVVSGNPLAAGKAKNPGNLKLNVLGLRQEIEKRGFATVYIRFAFNSAAIKPESRPQIDGIDALLREEHSWCLRIVGHTDATGDLAYNRELSAKRAGAVRQRLLDLGIEEGRLVAEGKGADQPMADNVTSEGRALNRRVELVKMDCP